MDGTDLLAERFEAHRRHLRAVAYRLLGSAGDADDAVQEAWLRASRAGADGVDNLGGWLTTIVARVSLNMLQSRRARREDPADLTPEVGTTAGPEQEAELADSVGVALLVVLETLTPAERLAFVLHDLFALPYEEIGPIVGRTPTAARQLASRARRRVRGATVAPDPVRQREVVAAFLAASRGGDFAALLALLDPEVVLRADAAAVASGATPEVRGAHAVAETFSGRARAARPALVDGLPGAAWLVGGEPRVVFRFTLAADPAGDRIVAVDLIADPEKLTLLSLTFLDELS
ncbi:sigma-70 family RNA polymerase sigma factor [Micromonospora endolithica]|uniref:Sigma-70 family RNA polymerase sigma factor n=1 Tax=Micromonospora endolithica TaxID=230091 RepID=A0A3A9ZN12_9ACTN|nr:sigma-70 family RNA polymerase sigma factor [Micromonospora endolithica]RKN49569.1 sigma-70 family RNA polymerase sigma factor [Micromonospora endolithica]TWJ23788.1 RNA polymerase sigma-70 factor (ECF subfamily) [Micromonospora endolithica]